MLRNEDYPHLKWFNFYYDGDVLASPLSRFFKDDKGESIVEDIELHHFRREHHGKNVTQKLTHVDTYMYSN